MSSQVILPENLSIHHITENFSDLKQIVESENDDVIFDATAVESIDTSGLQMLLAFVEDLKARDVTFSWLNPTTQLKEAAANIGLAIHLQLH